MHFEYGINEQLIVYLSTTAMIYHDSGFFLYECDDFSSRSSDKHVSEYLSKKKLRNLHMYLFFVLNYNRIYFVINIFFRTRYYIKRVVNTNKFLYREMIITNYYNKNRGKLYIFKYIWKYICLRTTVFRNYLYISGYIKHAYKTWIAIIVKKIFNSVTAI